MVFRQAMKTARVGYERHRGLNVACLLGLVKGVNASLCEKARVLILRHLTSSVARPSLIVALILMDHHNH